MIKGRGFLKKEPFSIIGLSEAVRSHGRIDFNFKVNKNNILKNIAIKTYFSPNNASSTDKIFEIVNIDSGAKVFSQTFTGSSAVTVDTVIDYIASGNYKMSAYYVTYHSSYYFSTYLESFSFTSLKEEF